jgi:prepilin-type N-terminal cleavage/methylation domain-containing protein
MRTRRRQGFTLIEVVVSLGIMTVSGVAVIALQQQITRANTHARQLAIATQIAQNWIERLKFDALRWNVAGDAHDLNQTTYLQAIGDPGEPSGFTPIPFQRPTDAGGVSRMISPAFNYYGDDLDMSAGDPEGLFYCASHRLNWIYDNRRVIRADVRVWWAREGETVIQNDYPRCADDDTALNPGSPPGRNFNRYHVVYLSTVLRAAP